MTKEDIVVPVPYFKVETVAGELKISYWQPDPWMFAIGACLLPLPLACLFLILPLWLSFASTVIVLLMFITLIVLVMFIAPVYLMLGIRNKATVRVTPFELEVKRGHFLSLFPRKKRLDSASIKQLYVKREKRALGSRIISYEVHAVTKSGRHEKLLTGLRARGAVYVEQEIRRFLGIEDRSVERDAVNFRCEQCGREGGQAIFTCPERSSGRCPYVEQWRKKRYNPLLLFIFGSSLCSLAFMGILSVLGSEVDIPFLLTAVLLGAGLLVGWILFVRPVERVQLYNSNSGVRLQRATLWGHELSCKWVTGGKPLPTDLELS